MQAPTKKTSPRVICPTPPPTLFGWLASVLGITPPAYRGAGQPTGPSGGTFGPVPGYRQPRPSAPASCHGETAEQQPPIEQQPQDGDTYLTQPLHLEGPVTIVVGTRE